MARKQRLDLHLVEQGLASSRQQAQQLIRAGKVRSADKVLDKPGLDVPADIALVVEQPPRFVSRGGEKLIAALEAFPIQLAERVCLDGGISTGGFTDCLLQQGASRVYGVDVGYGQTAWSLRTDPRLVLKERTNLRHLTPQSSTARRIRSRIWRWRTCRSSGWRWCCRPWGACCRRSGARRCCW